jgi:hypothetical protein
MRGFLRCRGVLVGVAALATVGLAACSANRAPSSAAPDDGHSATPAASADSSPAATAATTNPVGTSLVPMQTAAGGWFLSPSGNIRCQIRLHGVFCVTSTPPQSVTMGVDGSYTNCTGEQCLGQPVAGTLTLAYGKATGVGPFVCSSATTGVTCTADGKGFHISRAGIKPA